MKLQRGLEEEMHEYRCGCSTKKKVAALRVLSVPLVALRLIAIFDDFVGSNQIGSMKSHLLSRMRFHHSTTVFSFAALCDSAARIRSSNCDSNHSPAAASGVALHSAVRVDRAAPADEFGSRGTKIDFGRLPKSLRFAAARTVRRTAAEEEAAQQQQARSKSARWLRY